MAEDLSRALELETALGKARSDIQQLKKRNKELSSQKDRDGDEHTQSLKRLLRATENELTEARDYIEAPTSYLQPTSHLICLRWKELSQSPPRSGHNREGTHSSDQFAEMRVAQQLAEEEVAYLANPPVTTATLRTHTPHDRDLM